MYVSDLAVFKLEQGVATVSLTVEAKYSFVEPRKGLTWFAGESSLLVYGLDSETLITLDSAIAVSNFSVGLSVCPPGYVLDLRPAKNIGIGLTGNCVFCQIGTYSLTKPTDGKISKWF